MEFYKKRDFGRLISDTFQFFKENGKNYFKHFLLLNGLLIILLVAVIILGYREIIGQFFSSNLGGNGFLFQSYFQENQTMLIITSVVIFIISIAASVINISFPVFYMKRKAERPSAEIKSDDILSDIKTHGKRLFFLMLGLIFVVTPLAVLLLFVPYILAFFIIGIFLLMLVFPAILNAVNFLIFDYLNTNKTFFESLNYAVRAQFTYPDSRGASPFWKYWGSISVNYLMINVFSYIIMIIPMAIFFAVFFTTQTENPSAMDDSLGTWMGIVLFVCYGIMILFMVIMGNIIYINSGLMYYDNRIDLHRQNDLLEIESIGSHEA